MVLNSLFPVFALLAMGALFKRIGLTTDAFLSAADRLIYFIFFPALLFWKIGASKGQALPGSGGGAYLWAAACAVVTIFILSTIYLRLKVTPFQAGSFSQSCYRFNTYIGMAIIVSALGEEGVRTFGVLIGVLIPLINLLAVSTLTWFAGDTYPVRQRIQMTVRALVSNPLIAACLAGIAYSRFVGQFPVFIDNLLRLSASMSLPLAILSIGGSLTLSSLRGHFSTALAAAVFKLVALPLVGYGFLRWFGVTGIPYQVTMVFFVLPASTAIYVLSGQLKSDTRLASAAIVLSTVLSAIPLSMVLASFQ
ncbi:MAG: AEC family transporter [Desulfobacterales bacterium]|jgi:predicted permease